MRCELAGRPPADTGACADVSRGDKKKKMHDSSMPALREVPAWMAFAAPGGSIICI
jgi:hypothetical protein